MGRHLVPLGLGRGNANVDPGEAELAGELPIGFAAGELNSGAIDGDGDAGEAVALGLALGVGVANGGMMFSQ